MLGRDAKSAPKSRTCCTNCCPADNGLFGVGEVTRPVQDVLGCLDTLFIVVDMGKMLEVNILDKLSFNSKHLKCGNLIFLKFCKQAAQTYFLKRSKLNTLPNS